MWSSAEAGNREQRGKPAAAERAGWERQQRASRARLVRDRLERRRAHCIEVYRRIPVLINLPYHRTASQVGSSRGGSRAGDEPARRHWVCPPSHPAVGSRGPQRWLQQAASRAGPPGSQRRPLSARPHPSHVVSADHIQPQHQLLHAALLWCARGEGAGGRVDARSAGSWSMRDSEARSRPHTLPHLGAVHALVALVQDQVGGLVVAAQRALQQHPAASAGEYARGSRQQRLRTEAAVTAAGAAAGWGSSKQPAACAPLLSGRRW